MNKTIIALVLLFIMGCTKNTQVITDPPKHLIESTIASRTEVNFSPPKGVKTNEWKKTSIRLRFTNTPLPALMTANATDPDVSLINYQTETGKDVINIATLKRIDVDMRKFSVQTLDGIEVWSINLKNDGSFGNFKTYGSPNGQIQSAFGNCMTAEWNKCMDSWGCTIGAVLFPQEILLSMAFYCSIKVS